jgi:hypothetical protein
MAKSIEDTFKFLGVPQHQIDELKDGGVFAEHVALALDMIQWHCSVSIECCCPPGVHPADHRSTPYIIA